MACGLPTVCFDTPVNRELLGDDGIYTDYGDPENLALALANALADPDNLKKTAENLRKRAVSRHDWCIGIMQLEATYRKMLSSGFPLLQNNHP